MNLTVKFDKFQTLKEIEKMHSQLKIEIKKKTIYKDKII